MSSYAKSGLKRAVDAIVKDAPEGVMHEMNGRPRYADGSKLTQARLAFATYPTAENRDWVRAELQAFKEKQGR